MFSIVIPLYNKERLITRTLKSVLDQTFTQYEVLIVDDGSTDNSLNMVKSLKDTRIRILSKQNGGVSSARNFGIKNAKNSWIAFLDADDLWHPNHLQETYKAINGNKKLFWVFSNFVISGNGNENIVNKVNYNGYIADVLDFLNEGGMIQTSCTCIKTNVFENDNFLFNEKVRTSEDRELWYKLALNYPNVFFNRHVLNSYIVDKTSNSLTNQSIGHQETYDFLSMENRLLMFLNKVNSNRKDKFLRYLKGYNIKIILMYCCSLPKIPFEFETHLTTKELNKLSKFIVLPRLIKKIIFKFNLFKI